MIRRLPLLLIFLLVVQVFGQSSATGPEGSWLGTVDVGGQKLRVALTLSKNAEGSYSGSADSLDQGTSLPIDVITVNGDSVHIEFKTVGAVFDGKLNAGRSELSGQLSQRGAVLPLTFKRAPTASPSAIGQTSAQGPEGSWQGTLEAGDKKLRLALKLSKNPDGTYSGSLDSLDQGSTIPIDVVTVKGDSVRLDLTSISAVFEGKLSVDRSEITGQFTQGDTLPLTFKRTPSAAPAASPQTSATPPQRPIDVPIDVEIPTAPVVFKGGGKTHLVYEMHVTNFSRSPTVFTRLEVLAPDKTSLGSYAGDELAGRVVRPGVATTTSEEKLKVGPGLRVVTHMWVTFDSPAVAPKSIQHRLSFKVGDYPEELSVTSAQTNVTTTSLVISPPLRGSEWLAGNGPANTSGHRRALIPVGGGAHIAQRFAIDFLQLNPDGRSFSGDQKDNKSYRCYGSEALAVADGVVVETKDGIPENIPGATSRAVPITLETVGGNHIILDLGNRKFAFYAHLQPGSLRAKVGDKVRRGQVLGLVGNSGNSTEPHLHFHISDANSPLASEGLPYAFTSFEVQGKGWGWKPTTPAVATEKRQNEMPLELEVIRFP
jgi:acid stress-induced BolA-like protein IbaG/YrbA